ENAKSYLNAGASHVIVTSWVFRDGQIDWNRLQALVAAIGKDRLVLDLSCRKRDGQYFVVTNRWRNFTSTVLSKETLSSFATHCDEFLIHAVAVGGLCRGIDHELVAQLAERTDVPSTYPGWPAA